MLKEKLQKFFKIDRRWIFLLLAVILFIPIIKPIGLPNKTISRDAQNAYNFMDKLPAGSFVLFSLDYDPSTRPELHPQAVAMIRHAFSKNLRVGVVTYIAGATGLIGQIFEKMPQEYHKVNGTDYVIFLFGRYQESRSKGLDKEDAYYEMFHGTAHVILGSGLTIAGAMACLHFTRSPMFHSMGIPLFIGMIVVVLAAITLGPAVVTVASHFGALEPKRAMRIRFWRRIGAAVVVLDRQPGEARGQ